MVIEKLICHKQLRQIGRLELFIGKTLRDEKKQEILHQIWGIKKFFLKEHGVVDALLLTVPKILMAFERYAEDEIRHKEFKKASVELWENFVRDCTHDSTEIIEWYLMNGEAGWEVSLFLFIKRFNQKSCQNKDLKV